MEKLYVADIRGNVANGRITGHIVPVARYYKALFAGDCNVRIAAGPAILCSFDKSDCLVLPFNINGETLLDKLKTFGNFITLLWKSHRQPIVIQQSSSVTSFIAIAMFHWWTNRIYLIQYNTAGVNSKLKKLLYLLCKYKIKGLICPNENVGKTFGRPFCIVTDYIKTTMPTIKSFNERRWDICMVGSITKDKGVLEAAEFLADKKCMVLIAGQINEKQLENRLSEFRDKNSNLECHYEFVSDDDYESYIRNSRYCMLNYGGTYRDRSSGVVLDNIFLGTPVIGKRCNAMDIVEINNVGYVYDNLQNLNIESVITKEKFDVYVKNIVKFYGRQKEYKENLKTFLEL